MGSKNIDFHAHSRVRCLVFLHDGRYLLSGGDDGMIRQWRVVDGVQVGEKMKTSNKVTGMDLSSDEKWLVSSGERVANVWSMQSRQVVVTVNEHSDWVDAVHVSPDSTKFATGSNDKKVFIWDIFTGKRLIGPLKHEDRVGAVRFSPDGDRIATGTSNRTMRIYNTHNGELIRTIPVSIASYPTPIAWSSPQYIFALVSQKILMHININEGLTSSSRSIPGEPVNNFGPIAWGTVVSSVNGKFIASFAGHSISFWDPSTSAQISSDIRHPAHVWSIALSSHTNYLAISDTNDKIALRRLDDFISSYYLVGERVLQQPRDRNEDEVQTQLEALRSKLHALELRFGVSHVGPVCVRLNVKSDEFGGTSTRTNDLVQLAYVVPPPVSVSAPAETEIQGVVRCTEQHSSRPVGVPEGTYRIKSNSSGLYLTCPQDGTGTVIVQQLDRANVSQMWIISLVADGAYNIVSRRGNSDALLSTVSAHALACVPGGQTAWTFEPRGDAYVIGNAADARALHLRKHHRGEVSVSVRNNTQNQRWVLEHITD